MQYEYLTVHFGYIVAPQRLFPRGQINCLMYKTLLQVSASNKLIEALNRLHQRGMLSRFVIDEAHCVSQVSNFYVYVTVTFSNIKGKKLGKPRIDLFIFVVGP